MHHQDAGHASFIASFIVTDEPPPDYGSRVVHPGAQHKRAEEDGRQLQRPQRRWRRVEEAEAVACSERGAARLKIAQRHGARTQAADVPRCCEHRGSCGV